mgnify:CR=1 FL=1
MKNEEVIQNYLFHYNPYDKKWYAFRREDLNKYFKKNTLKAKNKIFSDTNMKTLKGKILKENK